MKNLKSLVFVLLICAVTSAQTGKVIKIKDGDTVVILDDNYTQHTIRVADIDCPEKSQPFGNKAKIFTSNQIFGKKVSVQPKDPNNPEDKYGRIIGYVLYEGKNLSHELLKSGYAWHYKYYSDDQKMAQLEIMAKKAQKGLWSDAHPINPYQWRKGVR